MSEYEYVDDSAEGRWGVKEPRPEDDALDRLDIAKTWIPGQYRVQADADLATVREALERQQSRIYILENMRSENYIEALESAEAEVRQLRERMADAKEQVRREYYDDGGITFSGTPLSQVVEEAIDSFIDALLSASPSDDDPPCPRCGMTAQVEASRSEPGRWMCHGCAQTFASPSDGGGAK